MIPFKNIDINTSSQYLCSQSKQVKNVGSYLEMYVWILLKDGTL